MIQLLLHLVGDYLTQSDWMALGKTKHLWIAAIHATVYSAPFLLTGSWKAVLLIAISHCLMDRYRLARYIVFAKNFLGTPWPKWEECKATGYPESRPVWLTVWLMTVADNTIHLACNYAFLALIK